MKICKVDGCERKHKAKGYCIKHWMQKRLYGKILKRTKHDPNEIIVKGDIAEIILYNNKNKERERAIIDSEDIKKVNNYKWRFNTGAVSTHDAGKFLGLHHVVLGIKPIWGADVDHEDGDILNNRKANIRLCTHRENSSNRKLNKNNTSGFKGVWWKKSREKWAAEITVKNKCIYLGYFKNKKDAAAAYNAGAIKHHGNFACLNEI